MESVTVIVLGYNSKPYLESCFGSLLQMESGAAEVEFLFVDNASDDGSADWVRDRFPQVRVIENPSNLGFSAGNNVGARHAHTGWLAFLNPDMRVASNWLAEMLRIVCSDPTVDCVASRIVNWDGSLIDFGGAAMNFYGYGMQEGIGETVSDASTEDRFVLFPCGGAMLVRREVFINAGGFDEDYFAFFEDVDLGWRLWVLGHTVKYAGQAVTYHHHHGSWGQATERRRQGLYERNALATILKNYEDRTLQKVLPAAIQLMSYRAFLTSGIRPDQYRPAGLILHPKSPALWGWLRDAAFFYGRWAWDTLWHQGPRALIRKGIGEAERRLQARRRALPGRNAAEAPSLPADPSGTSTVIPDRTLAYFEAAQSILDIYDQVMEKRQIIQGTRKRSDREIFPLFQKPLVPNYPDYTHLRAMHVVSDLWSLYDLFL